MKIEINNNSDIGVICGACGSNFTGKANCHSELAKMLEQHRKEHKVINDEDQV